MPEERELSSESEDESVESAVKRLQKFEKDIMKKKKPKKKKRKAEAMDEDDDDEGGLGRGKITLFWSCSLHIAPEVPHGPRSSLIQKKNLTVLPLGRAPGKSKNRCNVQRATLKKIVKSFIPCMERLWTSGRFGD